MNVTDAQRKALTLIHHNPGNVVAYQRGGAAAAMLKVNGNIERGLTGLGLAATVMTGVELYRDEDGPHYLECWELTERGRHAIGITTAPQVHPLTGMTTHALADYLTENVDADTLARIEEPDMHDLIDRLQRAGHISNERFGALIDQATAA